MTQLGIDMVIASVKSYLLAETNHSKFDKAFFTMLTAELEMSDILDLLVKATDAKSLINAYEDWEADNVPTTEPETAYQMAMWKREREQAHREFESNQAVKEVVKHG